MYIYNRRDISLIHTSLLVNHETIFEMTRFAICLSQILFSYLRNLFKVFLYSIFQFFSFYSIKQITFNIIMQ